MQMLINRIDIWESGFCEKKKIQGEKMKKRKLNPRVNRVRELQ